MSLQYIQSKLKAPKSQFNAFGKYSYRNLEDILEALKPLLSECKMHLIVSDEIISIGTRYYVKAHAMLCDENKIIAECNAFAREPENKKGMDESQITGATSSYARKYCLNGLFAIDDTKDADSHAPAKEEPVKPLTQEQKQALADLIIEVGGDEQAFCKYFKIKTVSDIAPQDYQRAMEMVEKKRKPNA
jgi:hypothetical protein